MLYIGDDYPGDPECKTMVKQVLAERFGLKTHRGSKEQPIYVLTSARTSPRLTKSEGDPNGLPGLTLRYPGDLAVRNATMGDFTGKLQGGILSRPVVDRTGIEGRFDFILKWTPDDVGPSQAAAAAANSAPGLATAIQEQLGLKLESTKSVASTLVVETVAHPTGN